MMMSRARLGSALPAPQRAAIAALVANPIYELVPIAGVQEAAAALPPHSSVTVTASPRLGVAATLDTTEWLVAHGHDACPHLAARSIRDRAHLAEIVARIRGAGIRKAFVVGGDGEAIGEFPDGLSLLHALEPLGGWLEEVGVPSYPEGHPVISDRVLLDDLRAKQPYAQATTTQMSFNPVAIADWIRRLRGEGVTLPIHLGVPGVLQLRKLMTIGTRIGVLDSTKYLMKNRSLLGHLVGSGAFGAEALLAGLAPTLADPQANVRALHVFTMNQVAETVDWQRALMAELSS
jgi:methylenetetrahydrofolate reductase (NADPH)